MRIAYFDCFSGISGDMTLGAFLDAGLSMKVLDRELKKLKLKGFRIKKSEVKRAGLAGTKFDCVVGSTAHAHRSLKDVIKLIEASSLGKNVKETAKSIFMTIGRAEAKVHGVKDKQDIKFHELGELDSIVDIVGTAIAIEELAIDEVYSSQVNLGRTFIRASHGALPIPGPASLELLKGAPARISAVEAELVTPTGAGILKALCKGFGEMPLVDIKEIGYGAGTKDLQNMPNMLRIVLGERVNSFKEDKALVIETNIDDMNPQYFEYIFERLFKVGALDVYTSNIMMKKSRPGFKLTVLSEPQLLKKMLSVIFSETTAIGARFYEVGRAKLGRELIKVKTRYGNVKVKLAKDGRRVLNAAPEYEDCVRVARKKKIPLKVICEEAKRAV